MVFLSWLLGGAGVQAAWRGGWPIFRACCVRRLVAAAPVRPLTARRPLRLEGGACCGLQEGGGRGGRLDILVSVGSAAQSLACGSGGAGGGIWDSPSYPFRRHPSVVRRSPFFAVRRRRRSPSSLRERGIAGGEGEAAGWSAASAHLLAGVSCRRVGSVDSGTMSPSTTPQPRFSARPPQGASCQVRLVQAWMAVFFVS